MYIFRALGILAVDNLNLDWTYHLFQFVLEAKGCAENFWFSVSEPLVNLLDHSDASEFALIKIKCVTFN